MGFQPSTADLDYPGKLQRLAQAHVPAASGTADREDNSEERGADESAPLAADDAQVCLFVSSGIHLCQVQSAVSAHHPQCHFRNYLYETCTVLVCAIVRCCLGH